MAKTSGKAVTGLWAKIAAVTKEAGTVEKDLHIKGGNKNYTAASMEAVLNCYHNLLVKYDLLLIPTGTPKVNVDVVNWKGKYDSTKIVLSGTCDYQIIDASSGEAVTVPGILLGVDPEEKAAGKAMSYALKTLMLQVFRASRVDENDADASEENRGRRGREPEEDEPREPRRSREADQGREPEEERRSKQSEEWGHLRERLIEVYPIPDVDDKDPIIPTKTEYSKEVTAIADKAKAKGDMRTQFIAWSGFYFYQLQIIGAAYDDLEDLQKQIKASKLVKTNKDYLLTSLQERLDAQKE